MFNDLQRLAKNLVHDRQEFDPNTYFAEHHNKVNMENDEAMSGTSSIKNMLLTGDPRP